jgi:hypothetical protein
MRKHRILVHGCTPENFGAQLRTIVRLFEAPRHDGANYSLQFKDQPQIGAGLARLLQA